MLKVIRGILAAIHLGFVGALGTLVCLFRPRNPSNAWVFARLIGRPGLAILGINLIVKNEERMDESRPCIFIANHQHNLDIFPLGAITPKRTVSLGKKSLVRIPFFGQFYWLAGNIIINRDKRHKALRSMDKVAQAIRERNTSLWIFPEGTRSKGKGIQNFKKGAFHTAINAGCPVVPVCVSSYHKNLNINRPKAGQILIDVLEPIETKGLGPDDVAELTARCQKIITEGVEKLDRQLG